jgi:hypothetical protein
MHSIGGRSVGIVRSRTQATEISFFSFMHSIRGEYSYVFT